MLAVFLLAVAPGAARPETLTVPAPGPKDTCPVCGMFVGLYPDWIATVVYEDGHNHHFDGVKDLFKYLLDRAKYAPGHERAAIAAIAVTDYYSVTRIDAWGAWYVIGSDVLGPMGHELVPLASQAEAEEFRRDHSGKRVLRFNDITPALLKNLDHGTFE
ncbi:MAG: nitrous oxide reductase accessory protein NosL [Candidatus Competibacter sp.]|nr:nitrous oxide reductase accessory protein NosL [Candidatus Competibacter sp.]